MEFTNDFLKQFCGGKYLGYDEEYSHIPNHPFTVGEYTYGTNSALAVRVPAVKDSTVKVIADNELSGVYKSISDNKAICWDVIEKLDTNDENWQSLSDVSIGEVTYKQCPDCRGTGKYHCAECNGTGTVVCEYDHEHDCPECDGEGDGDEQCEYCEGTGKVLEENNVRIAGGANVAEKMIRVLSVLPNVRIYTKYEPMCQIYFVFDGGIGTFMPVRD